MVDVMMTLMVVFMVGCDDDVDDEDDEDEEDDHPELSYASTG